MLGDTVDQKAVETTEDERVWEAGGGDERRLDPAHDSGCPPLSYSHA